MNPLQRLRQIEDDFNMSVLTTEQAIQLAKPLIEEANKLATQLFLEAKLPQKPTKIKLRNFAFGK